MRAPNIILAISAVAGFCGVISLGGVANATEISQAVEMCEARGPDCVHYYDGDGHEIFEVDNGENGKQTVICSHQSRDCIVHRRSPPRPRRTTTIYPRDAALITPAPMVRLQQPTN